MNLGLQKVVLRNSDMYSFFFNFIKHKITVLFDIEQKVLCVGGFLKGVIFSSINAHTCVVVGKKTSLYYEVTVAPKS